MKAVTESYTIMHEMLAVEELTNKEKINNLASFIIVVEDSLTRLILSSEELKECNDLLHAFEDKIKELKEE